MKEQTQLKIKKSRRRKIRLRMGKLKLITIIKQILKQNKSRTSRMILVTELQQEIRVKREILMSKKEHRLKILMKKIILVQKAVQKSQENRLIRG